MVDLVIADGVITKNEKDTVRILIAEKLKAKGLKGFSFTALHQYKQFYQIYPDFIQTVSELFTNMDSSIVQTLSEQSQNTNNQTITKWGTVSATLNFLTLSGKLETEYIKTTESELSFPPEVLLSRLSAGKDDALVEYATTGLPQEVFVSKYLVQLPSVDELKMLIKSDLKDRI